MEAWVITAIAVAAGAALGSGFTLGAHFNPGARALQNACRSLRQQNHQLQQELADMQAPAPGGSQVDGGGLGGIAEILSSGDVDLKSLLALVAKNPSLLKIGIQAIMGSQGGQAGAAAQPTGGAPRPPPGATVI